MKILYYYTHDHSSKTMYGDYAAARRIIPHFPKDWEVLFSHCPSKDLIGFSRTFPMARCLTISTDFIPPKSKSWSNIQDYMRAPLQKNLLSFDVPYVDAVITTTFWGSLERAYDYVKYIYELWKVNPNLYVLEYDGDRLEDWHSKRFEILSFLKEGHYVTVTPYNEIIFPNQLVVHFGYASGNAVYSDEKEDTYGFCGNTFGREKRFREYYGEPSSGLYDSCKVKCYGWGDWKKLKDDYRYTVFFGKALSQDEYLEKLRTWKLVTHIVKTPSYEKVGLIPLRIYETAEMGTLALMPSSIKNCNKFTVSDFIVNPGNVAEKVRFIMRLSKDEYKNLVGITREFLEAHYPITKEVGKIVEFLENKKRKNG